jgi:hypothetical protein
MTSSFHLPGPNVRLDWRGTTSGGKIIGGNFHQFPRFKLVYFSQQHPDLADFRITTVMGENCYYPNCDQGAMMHEFNITGIGAPREEVYQYKYLLDVDGNTFSGRFIGLLRSGSLVFKVSFSRSLRPRSFAFL